MHTIDISGGYQVIVSPEDFEMLRHYRWQRTTTRSRKHFYASRVTARPEHKTVLMHRQIMGATKGQLVDHINGNTLDNRRENLRVCTHAENMRNMKPHGQRHFKGTLRDKRAEIAGYPKTWYAKIMANGKSHDLGYYETEIEAALAYDEAALKYHGTFARLNFPGQLSAHSSRKNP